MKQKRKNGKGSISSFTGLFTRNFGLKLLSLVIALIVYGVLSPDAEVGPTAILPRVNAEIQIVKPKQQPAPAAVPAAAATNIATNVAANAAANAATNTTNNVSITSAGLDKKTANKTH